jgi:hypothetical protein
MLHKALTHGVRLLLITGSQVPSLQSLYRLNILKMLQTLLELLQNRVTHCLSPDWCWSTES